MKYSINFRWPVMTYTAKVSVSDFVNRKYTWKIALQIDQLHAHTIEMSDSFER